MPGIALVLGAGGTVGHAFHAGVLAALAEVVGWDARQADVVVGTSAGSAVAALLRAGMPPTDLLKRGSRLPLSEEGEAVVRRAGLGPPGRARRASGRRASMASPARLARAARAPWAVTPDRWRPPCCRPARSPRPTWPCRSTTCTAMRWPSRTTWIVAVQLDTGRRVAFGPPGAPPARVRTPCGRRAPSRRTSSRP